MLDYFIHIPVDDDFGVDINNSYASIVLGGQRKVEGIKCLSGSAAEVEPSLLTYKNFWRPVEKFLKYGKKITK